MKKRAITGLIMALVFIPLIIFPELVIPFQILMTIGVIIAGHEMVEMFNKEKPMGTRIKVITILLTLILFIATSFYTTKLENLNIINYIGPKFIIAVFLIVIIVLGLLVFKDDFKGNDIGKVILTVFYVGLGASSIVILRVLGLRFITYLFLTTVLTDVFAYTIGVKFGKHKMAPNISPKKSWEGAIGGTVVATIIAGTYGLLFGKIFPSGLFNPEGYKTLVDGISGLGNLDLLGQGLIIFPLTILLSTVGQIGDLVASKLKRTYDVKDFGNIFPGHGGVLDRFDSSFFASMFLVTMIMFLTATSLF
ncbi:phosphatidate cytidylyltransferase [Haploplasma axanthum]|uniref:Phosphatidate cytidylyltransferase n=1 Tax=Haploplasma axanthum TaxID=29552 RepID=A0A449BCT3_HAPAX|nr:phosphatidate cytidylyltransferase [Haploplasma axanthum]VEU80259.1 Phosphatidate cytidylyltransferase [Haploplasma axanthum]